MKLVILMLLLALTLVAITVALQWAGAEPASNALPAAAALVNNARAFTA